MLGESSFVQEVGATYVVVSGGSVPVAVYYIGQLVTSGIGSELFGFGPTTRRVGVSVHGDGSVRA